MNEMVRITERDMVAVALKPLKAGETVSYGSGEITGKLYGDKENQRFERIALGYSSSRDSGSV